MKKSEICYEIQHKFLNKGHSTYGSENIPKRDLTCKVLKIKNSFNSNLPEAESFKSFPKVFLNDNNVPFEKIQTIERVLHVEVQLEIYSLSEIYMLLRMIL